MLFPSPPSVVFESVPVLFPPPPSVVLESVPVLFPPPPSVVLEDVLEFEGAVKATITSFSMG